MGIITEKYKNCDDNFFKTSSSSEIENLVVKINKNGNFERLTGYNDVISFFKQFEYLPLETSKNLKFVL